MEVSFIGLGVMGFPMAGHLVSKNNNLKIKVYNRSKEKSEKWRKMELITNSFQN